MIILQLVLIQEHITTSIISYLDKRHFWLTIELWQSLAALNKLLFNLLCPTQNKHNIILNN